MASVTDLHNHRDILFEALNKYQVRDEAHKGLWREDEPGEIAGLALHKAKRLDRQLQRPYDDIDEPQAVDDALDLINYAVFVIRRLRGEAASDGE